MKYPNIEAERARNGMTTDALATALGVTRKTLYNWCVAGNIPQSALLKMSSVFNCSIDYLLAAIPARPAEAEGPVKRIRKEEPNGC